MSETDETAFIYINPIQKGERWVIELCVTYREQSAAILMNAAQADIICDRLRKAIKLIEGKEAA